MAESPTQKQVKELIKSLKRLHVYSTQGLERELHLSYMDFTLHHFGNYIVHFENAQPWIYYYCIHSLQLLGQNLSEQDAVKMKKALSYCFSEGFGGGYKQLPHLAPTYAAFLAVLQLGPDAYDLLDREKLYQMFKKCKKGKKFMMHTEGECDLRAIYIVALITKSLKLPQDILEGIEETVLLSQTHEGGISNVIGGEAHGGFTFCGVAALALLGKLQQLDISRLMHWLSQRQVQFGGFNGRTNKLIDSCYSHWVGSIYNILNSYFDNQISVDHHFPYLEEDLQKYVLFYCQDGKVGGLWDKPGKGRDIYHTCYALSGLSSSQQLGTVLNDSKLEPCNPIYNISLASYNRAQQYFASLVPL